MTPFEMSCMLLLERVGMLYGNNDDMSFRSKLHFESIFT
jgi:hypothetical protein